MKKISIITIDNRVVSLIINKNTLILPSYAGKNLYAIATVALTGIATIVLACSS